MTEEGDNVELVRRAIEAWNARDPDGLVALTTDDVEYVNPPNAVEPGTRRGRDELRMVARKQWEILDGAAWEIEGLHPRGEDEVICEQRLVMKMPGSDASVETNALVSWRFRDGLICGMEPIGAGDTLQEARVAAGLSDPADL